MSPRGWPAAGYETPSAFVAAFRRETGQALAAYVRDATDSPV